MEATSIQRLVWLEEQGEEIQTEERTISST